MRHTTGTPAHRRPRRRGLWAVATAAACLLTVGVAVPASATHGDGLFANLKGAKEVPGPGDPDGAGAAIVNLYPRAGKVCANISVTRIDAPVAAHIHVGRFDEAGPVVVDLTGSVTGGARCVTGVDADLIRDIRSHPWRYYVNVHNAPYPGGAVRGQLRG